MKKFFIMLATWLVLVIAVIIGSAIYGQFKSSEFDAAAVPYLEGVIPELSKWDATQTRQLIAPDALSKIPEDQYLAVIKRFSKMGVLRSLEKPKFSKSQDKGQDQDGAGTMIEYTIDARYEHGDALITIKLLYQDGQFAIYNFNLSSAALGT